LSTPSLLSKLRDERAKEKVGRRSYSSGKTGDGGRERCERRPWPPWCSRA
jgi:hypothetical protein